jgi:hypothetical protein
VNLELVARLVRHARFLPAGVHPAGRALALVPGLADALPDVPLPRDDRAPSFPVGCSDLLTGAVDRALRMALDDALADVRPPSIPELTERLQDDPLARGLRRLITEGLSLSGGAAAVVALNFARLCVRALQHPGPLLQERLGTINALPPERRGVAMARVAAPMQARLALAVNEIAQGGARPPALLGAIAANPLVFLFGPGTFDPGVDLQLLAGITGAPIDTMMAHDAGICFDVALAETLERLEGRRPTPADLTFAIRFNVPELLARGGDPAPVLRAEPAAWAHLLPQLAGAVSAGALVEAGADSRRAAELCRPDVALAVASTLAESLRLLQAWEVLAAAVACVAPTGEATIERQLLVPRGGPVLATIVAVSTGMLRTAVAEPVALSREVAEAVAGWRATLGGTALVADDGAVALFAFAEAARAVSFALSLRERPAAGLPVPSASIATGSVGGGTDGALVRLSGPAVQDALRLLPQAPLDIRSSDAPAISQVGLVDGSLRGAGVVAHTSTLDALRARRPRKVGANRPEWANEAWEDDLGVMVLIGVAGLADGCELARCAPADWQALCAAGDTPAKSPAPAKRKSTPVPSAAAKEKPAPAPPQAVPPPAPAPRPSRQDLANTVPRPIPAVPPSRDDDDEPPVVPPAKVSAPPPAVVMPGAATAAPAVVEAPRESTHELSRPVRARPTDPPAAAPPPPPPEPVVDSEPLSSYGAAFMREGAGSSPFAAAEATAPGPTTSAPTSSSPTSSATIVPDPFTGGDPFGGAPQFEAVGPPQPPAPASVEPTPTFTADPFAAGGSFGAGDPFAAPAAVPAAVPAEEPRLVGPSSAPPVSAIDPFSATESAPVSEFADIFGVPVGDKEAPPPSAPPPAIGAMGFVVEDAPTPPAARIDAPNEGFSLPVFQGDPSGAGPTVTAPAPEPRKARKAPMVDFNFQGYACYVERGRVVFGRPFGTRLVDLHVYDTGGDLERAYVNFMEAKIREGFIPQTELTGELPRTVTVMPLDQDRLADAWRALT